jgi:hypothetical protein
MIILGLSARGLSAGNKPGRRVDKKNLFSDEIMVMPAGE